MYNSVVGRAEAQDQSKQAADKSIKPAADVKFNAMGFSGGKKSGVFVSQRRSSNLATS